MGIHKLKWTLFRISRVQIEYPKEKTGYPKEYPKSVWITLDIQSGLRDIKSSNQVRPLVELNIQNEDWITKGYPEISVDISVDIRVGILDIRVGIHDIQNFSDSIQKSVWISTLNIYMDIKMRCWISMES